MEYYLCIAIFLIIFFCINQNRIREIGRYRLPAHFMLYYKQKIQEPANVNYPFNRTGLSGKHSDYNNNY